MGNGRRQDGHFFGFRGKGGLGDQHSAHKEGRGSKFCARYGLTRLVYAEETPPIEEAIAREKAMKAWKRNWKLRQIIEANPDWEDLFDKINH